MKIESIHIHNFRSIVDQTINLRDYSLLVGANNAGKSTVINAMRAYFGHFKADDSDRHCGNAAGDIWVECTYLVDASEAKNLPKGYVPDGGKLVVRRKLLPLEKKNVPGKLVYIPASSAAEE